jgi:omega-6 fatty acid desaturase (delta-12 desaturase)
VEDIVGTLMFMPLLYPFEPWRIKHNHHHAHTNKIEEDTAWAPMVVEHMDLWSKPQRAAVQVFLGTPVRLWASVGHWAMWHFDLSKYTEKQQVCEECTDVRGVHRCARSAHAVSAHHCPPPHTHTRT